MLPNFDQKLWIMLNCVDCCNGEQLGRPFLREHTSIRLQIVGANSKVWNIFQLAFQRIIVYSGCPSTMGAVTAAVYFQVRFRPGGEASVRWKPVKQRADVSSLLEFLSSVHLTKLREFRTIDLPASDWTRDRSVTISAPESQIFRHTTKEFDEEYTGVIKRGKIRRRSTVGLLCSRTESLTVVVYYRVEKRKPNKATQKISSSFSHALRVGRHRLRVLSRMPPEYCSYECPTKEDCICTQQPSDRRQTPAFRLGTPGNTTSRMVIEFGLNSDVSQSGGTKSSILNFNEDGPHHWIIGDFVLQVKLIYAEGRERTVRPFRHYWEPLARNLRTGNYCYKTSADEKIAGHVLAGCNALLVLFVERRGNLPGDIYEGLFTTSEFYQEELEEETSNNENRRPDGKRSNQSCADTHVHANAPTYRKAEHSQDLDSRARREQEVNQSPQVHGQLWNTCDSYAAEKHLETRTFEVAVRVVLRHRVSWCNFLIVRTLRLDEHTHIPCGERIDAHGTTAFTPSMGMHDESTEFFIPSIEFVSELMAPREMVSMQLEGPGVSPHSRNRDSGSCVFFILKNPEKLMYRPGRSPATRLNICVKVAHVVGAQLGAKPGAAWKCRCSCTRRRLQGVGRWNVPDGRQMKFQGSACPKVLPTEIRASSSRFAAGAGLQGAQASRGENVFYGLQPRHYTVCANRQELRQKMQSLPNSIPSLKCDRLKTLGRLLTKDNGLLTECLVFWLNRFQDQDGGVVLLFGRNYSGESTPKGSTGLKFRCYSSTPTVHIQWPCRDLNPGHLICEASVLPLLHQRTLNASEFLISFANEVAARSFSTRLELYINKRGGPYSST
ncbi:hypothetical protein CLF_112921 [Clonorchis sinensis]|uniref:Uncharacterized protein n=1 Tax=Clonorchis sinensis TaxID=79923 RepID=G7YX97_CLOSI|nr:hypothetical protein CLF_112921 [Clonorchis sinensis]